MRVSARALSFAIVLAWTAVLLRPGLAEETKDRLKPGHCPCSGGQACWHYLRTPLRPPEDPCRCGVCRGKGDCSSQERPEGWSGVCMGSQKPECFWKRHAASWQITCSACVADKECPACDAVARLPLDDAVRASLAHQVSVEGGDGAKRKMLVGWSPHFYMATDLPRLKLLTQGGAPRVAEQHEILHLFLERAEKAYEDFVEAFGPEVSQGKPLGIFLAEKKSKKESWQQSYFGNARTDMLYGGGAGRVAGGFCWNGFALSAEEDGNDRALHNHVRHMIGHILLSCWHRVSGEQKYCPKWLFCGAADWLAKEDPLFEDMTVVCQDEGAPPSGVQGDKWGDRARRVAAGRHTPIEKLFVVPSLSAMTFDDLVRSWSYVTLMLEEDRERWLATLREIRDGVEPGQAFQHGLGMTPDEFDRRWVDRMTGKRRSMGETPRDAAAPEDAPTTATVRKRIHDEQDPNLLAALLRGLERVQDAKTADAVLGRLRVDSDLVRETIVLLLSKTNEPEVVAYLRTAGLSDPDPTTRGVVARILGNLKDAAARPALEAMLGDAGWLARANAAYALALVADAAAVPALVAQASDANPKAWIAKADALATFGHASAKATPVLVKGLEAPDWQVRLTACRALAKVGDADAIEPLIARLETESGRLRREIHQALKDVSHETFTDNPQTWRAWWKMQKPHGVPPPEERPPNPEDDRYAKPKPVRPDEPAYYGRRLFSQSLLFVIDVSKSMDSIIHVPDDAAKRLGGIMTVGPRIQVAKNAATAAIGKLDPRARFNVVFFSTEVHPWQKTLVPASDATKADALETIRRWPLEDETNIYGALRAAVGLHQKPTLAADLDPIPDTIYFLTDGTPTRGEITDTETILSWMRDVNRFAKVELHVIAMGNLGVDLDFLARLASENAGEFLHIPEE